MKIIKDLLKQTKRYLSASNSMGFLLVLKWRLVNFMAFGVFIASAVPSIVAHPVLATSITMTAPSTLSVNVNSAINNGFAKSSISNVSVETDGLAGYTLTIEAHNGNQLVNGSHRLNTLPEKISEADYISNAKYNNTWGILPSKVEGKINNDFLPGPATDAKITIDTTDTANKGNANTYGFTLGAKVDGTMVAGSYTNTFILVATVNIIQVPETMQDFVKYDYCSKMTLHQELTLTDARDGSDYKVSRLADGKCWMVQNLRITGKTITAEDSDLDSGSFVIPVSDVAKFTSTDFNNDAAYDSEDKDIGAYYSWHTATAGADPDVLWTQGIHDAPNSICPKGWHLTTAGDFGNYAALFYNYARQSYDNLYEAVTASPGPNLKPSGYHNYDGTFQKDGQEGWYYSSTISVATGSNTHQVIGPQIVVSSHKANLITPGSTNRQNGRTIRCVTGNTPYSITYNANGDTITKNVDAQTGTTKETTITLTKEEPTRTGYAFSGWCNKAVTGTNCQERIYQPGDTFLLGNDNNITLYAMWQQTSVATMQNFDCSSLKDGEVTVLLDTRDQNKYAVAKLKDGRCWMTQNLRLGGNTPIQLNSGSSGVTDSFILPQSTVAASSDANMASIYAPGYGSNYGNYYNWYAATANSYSETTAGYAANSICPKGWGLPSDYTYDNLIKNYGKISVLRAPANFTVLGQINVAGMFSDGGNFGRAWTNHYDSLTAAGTLRIVPFMNDSKPLNSTATQNPTLRIGVRCVAQQKYTIKYELNGGTGGPETNPQTGEAKEGSGIELDATPTKDGFWFMYWCTANNTANPTTCSSASSSSGAYAAGQRYDFSNGVNITLYATWARMGDNKESLGNMQSFSCSMLPNVNDYGTVTDTRDNNTYHVRKLADGKCWMIDNLKIQNKTLTPADSDVSSSYVLRASNKSGFYDGINYISEWLYIADGSGGNKVEYGGYYSWKAATAATGIYDMTSGDNATNSICPKGWRLPNGDSSGDFKALSDALGGNTGYAGSAVMRNPNGPNFFLAGFYKDSSLVGQGSESFYWSNTAYNRLNSRCLEINSSSVDSVSYGGKNFGGNVRCIAR